MRSACCMSCFLSMRTDKSSRNQEVKKMFFSQYTFCPSNHIAIGVAGYFPGHFWDIPHKNILIILWSMLRSNQLLLRNNFSLQNFVFLSLLAERWKWSGYPAFKSEIIYSQQTSLVMKIFRKTTGCWGTPTSCTAPHLFLGWGIWEPDPHDAGATQNQWREYLLRTLPQTS